MIEWDDNSSEPDIFLDRRVGGRCRLGPEGRRRRDPSRPAPQERWDGDPGKEDVWFSND